MRDDSSFYLEIGRQIKAARIAKGIKQIELAERLSISRPSLSNIENGKQQILLHNYFEIYNAIGNPRDIIRV